MRERRARGLDGGHEVHEQRGVARDEARGIGVLHERGREDVRHVVERTELRTAVRGVLEVDGDVREAAGNVGCAARHGDDIPVAALDEMPEHVAADDAGGAGDQGLAGHGGTPRDAVGARV